TSGDATPDCLVEDAPAQPDEDAGMSRAAVFASTCDWLFEAVQVFDGDCLALPHETAATRRVASATRLGTVASEVVASADEAAGVDDGSGELLALALRCQVHNAQVDSQRSAYWHTLLWLLLDLSAVPTTDGACATLPGFHQFDGCD